MRWARRTPHFARRAQRGARGRWLGFLGAKKTCQRRLRPAREARASCVASRMDRRRMRKRRTATLRYGRTRSLPKVGRCGRRIQNLNVLGSRSSSRRSTCVGRDLSSAVTGGTAPRIESVYAQGAMSGFRTPDALTLSVRPAQSRRRTISRASFGTAQDLRTRRRPADVQVLR